MKKLALVALSAVFALGLSLAHAADAPKGPVKIGNFGKKEVVSFDHAKHKDAKCDTCHHTKANEKGDHKCSNCHKAEAAGKAPKFQDAAHKKDQGVCYGCHLAADAKHKMKCADCHKK
ncbi:MAG: hypothetical protein HY900_26220 [Deltaproteobacteria bacterium]|nr:hypothetical protein [Deltaproteobacteria bacterium]